MGSFTSLSLKGVGNMLLKFKLSFQLMWIIYFHVNKYTWTKYETCNSEYILKAEMK